MAMVSTMVVLREPDEVFLLCHTGGDAAVSWVEQIHPLTLETLHRSPDLAGGPTWPGGLAAHADGSLHVVFGNHAHRLSASLAVEASVTLPRHRPYNSFVTLPDGHLVAKDFGGILPGGVAPGGPSDTEVVVLRPDTLAVAATAVVPEPSIARLSADGDIVYVVGTTRLWRLHWRNGGLALDTDFAPHYVTMPGQTYGWDAVLAGGAAWFLDNGEGSERYAGTFRGVGSHTTPLHLVRVDLGTGEVDLHEVCGLPGGLIANPPAIDLQRQRAVGYDSGNGVVTGFRLDGQHRVDGIAWQRHLNHGAHPLRFEATGELLLLDHRPEEGGEQAVVLDIVEGRELGRVATGSPVQSVVFTAPGWHDDAYICSFTTLTRIVA
ncbi:MAG TPA: hypothetical protein DCR14_12270 [Acidimicrobiaceae bacterium]|nr:hypothetical protein [Acidimicrobiaceae bacterium]